MGPRSGSGGILFYFIFTEGLSGSLHRGRKDVVVD
jgi:hypothetical protein